MSRLNWRNVAAPDFSTSLSGIRTASGLLNDAFQSASNTLESHDARVSERVNKAILAQIAGIDTAEGAEAQVQDILSGADLNRVDANTILFGANRADTLLSRDNTRQNIKIAGRNFERQVDNEERLDAAEPALKKYYAAARSGNAEEQAEALSELENSGLRASQFVRSVRDAQGIRSGEQGIQSGDLSLERSQYNFDREKLDNITKDRVTELMPQIMQLGTVQDAVAAIQASNESPRVKSALLRRVGAPGLINLESFGGGGSVSGGTGSINIGEAQTTVASTLQDAGLSAPVIAGFLGNFEVEGGYTGAIGDNGTASGIAQWRGARRSAFRDQYGKDPHQATPAEQAQFVLWELTTPEGRKVAGISEQQANAILNAQDAGQAAELIDKFYERSNGKHRSRRVSAANAALQHIAGNTGRAQAIDSVSGDPVVDGFFDNIGKARSTRQVAKSLTGEDGLFSGTSTRNVETELRRIQTKAREIAKEAGVDWSPNADQAASLLAESRSGRNLSDFFSDTTGIGSGSIDGTSVDEAALRENVKKIVTGQAEQNRNAQARIAGAQQSAQALASQIQRQQALVQTLQNRPGVSPLIVQREATKLQQLLQAANQLETGQRQAGDQISYAGGQDAPTRPVSREVLKNFVARTPPAPKRTGADRREEFLRMFSK